MFTKNSQLDRFDILYLSRPLFLLPGIDVLPFMTKGLAMIILTISSCIYKGAILGSIISNSVGSSLFSPTNLLLTNQVHSAFLARLG